MKIVHVTGYFPPHVGGAEYRTYDLAKRFATMGHSVQIFSSNIGCERRRIASTKNLQIYYLKSIEVAHTPIMPTLALRLLRIPKDSVIHLHIAHAYIAEITYVISKLRNIPYIAHVHLDVEQSGKFGFLLPLYKKLFLKRILQGAQTITVLTADYKHLVHKKYQIPLRKIIVIPNGTYFSNKQLRKDSVHKPTQLLFVGRLSVQKNIPLLINAIKICVSRFKLQLHLNIAGDGELREDLKKLVENLQLVDYITFLGAVSPMIAQRLYNNSDILILPSRSESFGSVIIEAMASGTPVIATNILGVRNIVKNRVNGLLVNENPLALAEAVQLISRNGTLRQSLIKNGLIDVKKYSWDAVAKQYENVYKNVFLSKNK